MGRERAGRPGVTWDRELVRQEVYVGLDKVPTEETLAFSDELAEPVAPPLNREQRRALKRAARRKGGKR